MTLRILDLFSGIGGFSLGLERAGMRTVAFCEVDPFCRRVLAKHWPGVPCYDDVRTLTAARLAADGISDVADSTRDVCTEQAPRRAERERIREGGQSIDLLCGGFPCQDISVSGKGAGIDGARSGLWAEFARIIGEVRPRFVIVENVAALLGRGLARVLGDLATLGFDAEWCCIRASDVGAPHRRDRVWIVANAVSYELRGEPRGRGGACGADQAEPRDDGAQANVANATCQLFDRAGGIWPRWRDEFADGSLCDSWMDSAPRYRPIVGEVRKSDWWKSEPDVGRVAHGVPARVERLRALGNAVVPQIPELIGRAIMEAYDQRDP